MKTSNMGTSLLVLIEFKLIRSTASTLFCDIILAKKLFLEKHAIFKKLSAIYADNVPEWNRLDHEARTIPKDKEVRCVYRQYSKKGSHCRILLISLAS